MVTTIAAIYRYPVKGLSAEKMNPWLTRELPPSRFRHYPLQCCRRPIHIMGYPPRNFGG